MWLRSRAGCLCRGLRGRASGTGGLELESFGAAFGGRGVGGATEFLICRTEIFVGRDIRRDAQRTLERGRRFVVQTEPVEC